MERLSERLAVARKALATLVEAIQARKTRLNRDASIQRFEYTYETVWKTAQNYLSVVEQLTLGSPSAVIRGCFQAQLLDEEQARAAMRMAQDRNLTVHTYNEALAEEIYARLPAHAQLMEEWLKAMDARMTSATS
jgi:nucleotidyltransferase substrate binding protein (TIGR01987 family)